MQNAQERFGVLYENDQYDIEQFLQNHPGGVNYLAPYKGKDISKRMQDTNHSRAAFYLFKEYKKDGRRKQTNGEEDDFEVSKK